MMTKRYGQPPGFRRLHHRTWRSTVDGIKGLEMIKLAQFFNRTILVCIPSLYDDGQPRPYTLVGIEPEGLWLESEEFVSRLLPPDNEQSSLRTLAAFIPFAQILYVLDGTYLLTPAQSSALLAVQTESSHKPVPEANPDKPRPASHAKNSGRARKRARE
jgi:hypothetical protein